MESCGRPHLFRQVSLSAMRNYLYKSSSCHRASLRVTDTYLHVPGYHPSVDNPAFFQQRVDDPSILPSLHKHLWGRVASLGCLTLQIEKKVHVKTKDTPSSSNLESGGGKSLDFGREPLVLSGEGNGLMLEWSQPSIIMLAKVLEYYQREHADLFPSLSPLTPEGEKDVQSRREFTFPTLLIHFQLSNINLFMYGLTPGMYISPTPLEVAGTRRCGL